MDAKSRHATAKTSDVAGTPLFCSSQVCWQIPRYARCEEDAMRQKGARERDISHRTAPSSSRWGIAKARQDASSGS